MHVVTMPSDRRHADVASARDTADHLFPAQAAVGNSENMSSVIVIFIYPGSLRRFSLRI